MIKFIRCAQGVLIIAGITLVLGKAEWFPVYYRQYFMGSMAFVYVLFIELPRFVWKADKQSDSDGRKLKARLEFQSALAVGILLCGLGSLGLWGTTIFVVHYDKLIHFLMPFGGVFFGARLFNAFYDLSVSKSILLIFIIVAPLGVVWEVIEFIFFHYFRQGYFGTLFDQDSAHDIYFHLVGTFTGALADFWSRHADGV